MWFFFICGGGGGGGLFLLKSIFFHDFFCFFSLATFEALSMIFEYDHENSKSPVTLLMNKLTRLSKDNGPA